MNRMLDILSLTSLSLAVSRACPESKIRTRAETGDAEGQYQLASMNWDGRGVHRDPQEALEWYQTAAAQGHLEAQMRVAELYERGEGISRDYVKASQMYIKAAEPGDPKSQIRLTQLYLTGHGVPQNYTRRERCSSGRQTRRTSRGNICWASSIGKDAA